MAGYIGKTQSVTLAAEADTLDSVTARGATTDSALSLTNGLVVDKDGATVATFDRATSDGTIVDLQKNGTTVGSIGTYSGFLNVANDSNGLAFGDTVIYPSDASAGGTDGVVDLGGSSARFKDLYLSGGVYLGGTGAANYLDDYEEGTFTASDASLGGLTFTYIQTSKYVVVGKICFITVFIQWPSTSDTNSARVSLPFTPDATYSSLSKSYINGASGQTNWLPLVNNGAVWFDLRNSDGGDTIATNANLSSKSIIVSGFYKIA